MLRYLGFVKQIFELDNMGGGMIVLHSLKTKGNKKNIIFKLKYDPFIFAKKSLSKIWSINWDRVLILGQNVKIYSA